MITGMLTGSKQIINLKVIS